jgi:hypothetical protein
MATSIYHRLAPLTMGLVIATGAANWYLKPDAGAAWALGMFFLPAVWLLLFFTKRFGKSGDAPTKITSQIYGAMTGAGLLLMLAMCLPLAENMWGLSDAAQDRMTGVAMGLVLVVMGNYLPKRLQPLSQEQCDPAKVQASHRFAGWSLVLGGLLYVFAWLILPLSYAGYAAVAAGAGSVIIVLLRSKRPRRVREPS